MDLRKQLRSVPILKPLVAIAQFLAVGILFGLAYVQDPIYHSPENQNTKYLQGLAHAGHGFLSNDWTANTLDPLPAFTALVRLTYQFIHPEYAFYGYYFLIFGVYAYSLLGIASYVFKLNQSRAKCLVFLALLIFTHTVEIEIFDVNTNWVLQAGVAQQYILGPVFQPCNFGAFILLSILVFLHRRPFLAVALLALAGTLHPAYFPSVGALTLAYMAVILKDNRNWRKALAVGVVSGLLILPVFSYMYFTFADTNPELAQRATDIIVNERIPHHSIPAVWLDGEGAYFQTIWVAIAIVLVRHTPLATILLIPYAIAVSLTGVQMLTDSDMLAFIAPWRISVFLVPVATGIILGQFISWLFRRFHRTALRHEILIARASIAVILTLAIIGGYHQVQRLHAEDETFPMMKFVRDHLQAEQTYLIPPDSKELRKFRLYTGAPILVTRKTHPYQDIEVIEWNHRLELGKEFYKVKRRRSCRMLRNEFSDYGITHVVLPKENFKSRCRRLVELYRDEEYGVYSAEKLVD